MKLGNVMVLLLACFLVQACSNKESAETIAAIEAKLNREIADLACVRSEAFPFSSKDSPDSPCWGCDKLVDAGLVTKEVYEDSAPERTRGNSGADVRFELTDLGIETFELGSDASPYGKDSSRFCFGKVRVNRISKVVGPVRLGGNTMIGIRYIAEVENPHPFLFDPLARHLDIPLPDQATATPGKSALYPERNVTAVFFPNDPGNFDLDASMTIGD